MRKSWVLTFLISGSVDIAAKSPVIIPLSMVSIVACSSLPAKSTSLSLQSNCPRFLRAPVQAKSVATELVEVSSPLRCYNKCRVTVPWAASYSQVPSGATRTEVIMPRLPKAVATMSLMTSPS